MNCIREVLVEQGRSQKWLSEKLGKSVIAVNAYCTNKTQPKLDVLYDIAELLEVSIHDLILKERKKPMGVFRFSNAVSDIGKFIGTYATLYNELKGEENFSHDDARDALIEHGLVSSSGAIGKEAVKRSERPDRSRDPLYNQLKMYSEVFRMLGWYKPGTKRTNFNFTAFGEYIAEGDTAKRRKHFEFSVLHIVSPSPLVEIKGGNILRPFPLILELMDRCGGVLTRDEIIITVLNCQNDKVASVLDDAVSKIESLRGDTNKIKSEIELIKSSNGIGSDDTLKNYTRFPLGALKWLGWAEPKSNKELYEKSIQAYHLTDIGRAVLDEVRSRKDIRVSDLSTLSEEELAKFALIIQYKNMEFMDYQLPADLQAMIAQVESEISEKLRSLGITDTNKLLFSAIQEIEPEIIKKANEIEEEYEKA